MYFDVLSLLAGAPVLICPASVPTAMSAIMESEVSPERWLMTVPYPAAFAIDMTNSVSVTVPI